MNFAIIFSGELFRKERNQRQTSATEIIITLLKLESMLFLRIWVEYPPPPPVAASAPKTPPAPPPTPMATVVVISPPLLLSLLLLRPCD